MINTLDLRESTEQSPKLDISSYIIELTALNQELNKNKRIPRLIELLEANRIELESGAENQEIYDLILLIINSNFSLGNEKNKKVLENILSRIFMGINDNQASRAIEGIKKEYEILLTYEESEGDEESEWDEKELIFDRD